MDVVTHIAGVLTVLAAVAAFAVMIWAGQRQH
jgi:hypothetical protein